MGRAPCCDKANVKKGPWAPEEDAKLKAYIEQNGTGGNWIALPQKIGLKRCGKSCRLRWLNYLRPNIKHGGFTEEEDNIICSLYISIGSRWSIIAAQLPGRTDNDIKNYWNTRLKKKLLGRRKQNRIASIPGQDPRAATNASDENSCNLQNLSSSALERLQLHMQLQNPFSLYNNPALWPKLNPMMIQSLLNQNNQSNFPVYQQNTNTNSHEPVPLVLDHQQDYSNLKSHNPIDNGVVNGNFSSPESSFNALNPDQISTLRESGFMEPKNTMGGQQVSSGFSQAELDALLNVNKSLSVLFPNDQSDFDCFNGSKDMNLDWWTNELEAASTSSSNSWLHQSDQDIMYQDYSVIGYGMQ